MNREYLEETKMLNYNEPQMKLLVSTMGWLQLDDYQKIKSVYEFVQNDILFGYNSDMLNAVQVLNDGIGHCNTKATLLMALLRAVNIPCRLHAFDVAKDFQLGALPKVISLFAPKYILHTWVEVFYQDKWIVLEGVITDKRYLSAVQKKYFKQSGVFKKYAIATKDLKNTSIDWIGKDTFIQKEAIVHDYGVFSSPDVLFLAHAQQMSKVKYFIFTNFVSKIMTRNVSRIRNRYLLQKSDKQ